MLKCIHSFNDLNTMPAFINQQSSSAFWWLGRRSEASVGRLLALKMKIDSQFGLGCYMFRSICSRVVSGGERISHRNQPLHHQLSRNRYIYIFMIAMRRQSYGSEFDTESLVTLVRRQLLDNDGVVARWWCVDRNSIDGVATYPVIRSDIVCFYSLPAERVARVNVRTISECVGWRWYAVTLWACTTRTKQSKQMQ